MNKLTHRLRGVLLESRNESFQHYITNLSPEDYSTWRAAKKFKRPIKTVPPIKKPNDIRARSDEEKAEVFANHLANVFKPIPPDDDADNNEINDFLDRPCQLHLPIRAFSPIETSCLLYTSRCV